jgi:hypothetical protein
MTQPTLPNRKPPVFARCPVCGADFWRSSSRQRSAEQLWCSRECAWGAKRQTGREAKRAAAPAPTPAAIRLRVDADAGMMWRELVRRPTRKDRL